MVGTEVSPTSTLVIILGASAWPSSPDLASSPAFQRSAQDLREYFLSQDGFRLPGQNLLYLFDTDRPPSDVDADIGDFLKKRAIESVQSGDIPKDLLLYYVGHGGFTRSGRNYYLAIRATRKDSEGVSSLRMADLAATLL